MWVLPTPRVRLVPHSAVWPGREWSSAARRYYVGITSVLRRCDWRFRAIWSTDVAGAWSAEDAKGGGWHVGITSVLRRYYVGAFGGFGAIWSTDVAGAWSAEDAKGGGWHVGITSVLRRYCVGASGSRRRVSLRGGQGRRGCRGGGNRRVRPAGGRGPSPTRRARRASRRFRGAGDCAGGGRGCLRRSCRGRRHG